MLRQSTTQIEPEEITLELLQSYYNVPLAELAKELGLSLTLLKKICRKFGIQRWPHRQIRSINKNIQDLNERINSVNSPDEHAELRNQIGLLEKKRRLVTKGASSGLHTAMRNAIFLANPEHLQEESMFEGLHRFPQLQTPQQHPSIDRKPSGSMDKLKMRMYPNRSPQLMVGKDMLPSNHMGIPAHPTNSMFSAMNNPPMGESFRHPMQEPSMCLSQAQMMQVIMQQQMQMNNFICHQPMPMPTPHPIQSAMNYQSMDPNPSANESIPFLEIAAMLNAPEDDEMDCGLFDVEQPHSSHLGQFRVHPSFEQVPSQALPNVMNTGNSMFSEGNGPLYFGGSSHFSSIGAFQSL
mmetsp:Transcript_17120/g.25333  ORF Transcript_17120/g.25333 Transcript_17120/m.25333 type:complete len:352 (-) Transcript_17120:254-1309(-)